MKVDFHRDFLKIYRNCDKKIQKKVDETISSFVQDPYMPKLRNHALKWDFVGKRSINVTGDWRIVFEEKSDNRYELVELIYLGTHSMLY
jgi:addiction module RelE/StbE family toxin